MDRIEYLKTQKYPALDPAIIDAAVSADPTTEKKFVDWIIRMHVKSGFIPSEFPSISETLSTYNSIKHKMNAEQKDINRFSSPILLSSAVLAFMRTASSDQVIVSTSERNVVYNKMYEDGRWLVIRPLTFEAGLKYGKSTKWCTAAKNAASTFYNYLSTGSLYIVLDKTKRDGNCMSKIQLHFTNNGAGQPQFMDSLNEPINLPELLRDNKCLWDTFRKEGEFEKKSSKIFERIHNPMAMSPQAQLSSFKKNGFAVMCMVENPSDALFKCAMELILEKDNWDSFIHFQKHIDSEKVQSIIVSVACDADNEDDVKRTVKEIIKLSSKIHNRAMMKAISHYPEIIFEHNNPTTEMFEVALENRPSLFKRIIKAYNASSREWIIQMIVRNPDILEVAKVPDLSEPEIILICNSRKFEGHHMQHIKNVPENIQLKFIKRDVNNYQFIRKPSKRVMKAYEEKRSRESARESKEDIIDLEDMICEYEDRKHRYDYDRGYWDSNDYVGTKKNYYSIIKEMKRLLMTKNYR